MTQTELKLRQSSFKISTTWTLRLLAVALLLGLSMKYKEVGSEGIRPFHSSVIIALAFAGAYFGAARLPGSLHVNPISILLYACAAYLLFAGALAGERGLKDGGYVVANSVGLYWLISGLMQWIGVNRFLDEASHVARLLGFAVTLPTLVVWVWPFAGLGLFEPSPSYLARAHGMLGDPTNFGCFCSVALLFTVAWRKTAMAVPRGLPVLFDQTTIALLMLSIVASGSRMAIAGCGVGFAILLVFRQLRWRATIIPALASILLYPALLYLKAAEISSANAAKLSADGILEGPQVLMGQLAEGAFRIDEGGGETRQRLFQFALESYRSLDLPDKIFGCGYQCIETLGRSSHIGYLDLLVNYGLVFSLLFGALLLITVYVGLLVAKQGHAVPLALICFFIVATAFLTWPFNAYFNAPFFGAVIGFASLALGQPRLVAPLDTGMNRTALDRAIKVFVKKPGQHRY